MTSLIKLIALALMGASLGSFLNTVVLQRNANEPITRLRSHCPHCHQTLHWFELIPIVSYLVLKGHCRSCGHVLSKRYLIIEVSVAMLWLGIGFLDLSIVNQMTLGSILSTLVYIALRDHDAYVMDDLSVLILSLLGWLWNQSFPLSQLNIVLALWVCSFLAYIAHRTQSIGSGDIYLLFSASLFLGYPALMHALLIGSALALIHRLIQLARHEKKCSDVIAYASYLSLGIGLSLLYFRTRI